MNTRSTPYTYEEISKIVDDTFVDSELKRPVVIYLHSKRAANMFHDAMKERTSQLFINHNSNDK
jgi:hypothetical protein